jgi:hypothetical protein
MQHRKTACMDLRYPLVTVEGEGQEGGGQQQHTAKEGFQGHTFLGAKQKGVPSQPHKT